MMTEYVDTTELLQQKVAILKKNRELIPAEELKTKYKKSYLKLLNEISELAKQVVELETIHFAVPEDFIPDGIKFINENFTKEVVAEMQDCLYKEYSVEKLLDMCQNIRNRFCVLLFSGKYDFSKPERYNMEGRKLVAL